METMRVISSLSVFEKVAKNQSYSLAAKEMGVSKAYVSKIITSLEEEFGEKLFIRSTRKVKLSYLGEELLAKCSSPLNILESISESLANRSPTPKGVFKVSLAGAYGEDYIAPVLFKMAKEYPDLKVDISFSTRNVDLLDENVDVAIRVGDLADSNLYARKISFRREYICATKKYVKLNGEPKSPKELKEFNCLMGVGDYWSFIIKKKVERIKLSGNIRSDNGRVLLKAALDSIGLVKLPDVYVKEYIDSGKLLSVLDSYLAKEIPIWAVTHTRKKDSVNLQHFLDLLEEFLKREKSL
ncbi:LysR substrate-binding domain-containing protein [Halobacteriovorax marinus]|nr:LysR substrate-binding domain-containing protein [Halobacteriovorax marinus]